LRQEYETKRQQQLERLKKEFQPQKFAWSFIDASHFNESEPLSS